MDNRLDGRSRDPLDRGQKCPLIGMRCKLFIDKDAVAGFPRLASAAAERSGCRIRLAATCPDWERSDHTSRVQCPAGAPSFRSGCGNRASAPASQESGLRRTSRRVRHCQIAIAPERRAVRVCRHVSRTASASSCQLRLVKIDCQKETGFVQQHRVNAGDEIGASVIAAGKMPPNHVIGYRQKLPMLAGGTLDSRLLADSPHPFIRTSWREYPDLPDLRLSKRRG